jgi:hypothetical protein
LAQRIDQSFAGNAVYSTVGDSSRMYVMLALLVAGSGIRGVTERDAGSVSLISAYVG